MSIGITELAIIAGIAAAVLIVVLVLSRKRT